MNEARSVKKAKINIGKQNLEARIIEINSQKIPIVKVGQIAEVKHGMTTGDNQTYIYAELSAQGNYKVANHEHVLSKEEMESLTRDEWNLGFDKAKFNNKYLVPHDKGGASDATEGWLPNYFVPTKFYIKWDKKSVSAMMQLPGHRHDNPQYYGLEGLTFSPTGEYAPTFRLNSSSVFGHKGSNIFTSDLSLKMFLALLCSKFFKYLLKNYVNHSVDSTERPVSETPMPIYNLPDKIVNLVESIILKQNENQHYDYARNEQKEIDASFYEIYGLAEDDIREVELWYCRRYPRLAEAQGLLAEVREKYVEHLSRCQRILEAPPSYWKSSFVLELIFKGESHCLEFKETLEYDIRTSDRNPGLVKSCLRTIAAFLNTDGGILLIGVSDDGEIKGIKRDLKFVKNKNSDGFEQKLRSLLKDHFDPIPLGNVEISFEILEEGMVCQIKVEKSSEVIAYDNEFFVRDGNVIRKLEGRRFIDWLKQRSKIEA
jgi:hypothetical protein